MAMTIETITDTDLNYSEREMADQRCDELNNARYVKDFNKHFVRQIRFDHGRVYHTIVCVNREIRP